MKAKLLSLSLVIFIIILLCNPSNAIACAGNGLLIWFQTIIPVLFPYMILSSFLISLGGIEYLLTPIQPIFQRIFHTSKSGTYVLLVGLFFGMPMASKTITNLLEAKQLSNEEALWLFSFCNQLSPNFLLAIVLPQFQITKKVPVLIGFYGIPLLYGLLTRKLYPKTFLNESISVKKSISIIEELNNSILNSIQTILGFGGYIIFFHTCYLLFKPLEGFLPISILPLLEISGGIITVGSAYFLYGIWCCSFGGICGLFQTILSIQNTFLTKHITLYIKNRILISCLVTSYFFLLRFFL